MNIKRFLPLVPCLLANSLLSAGEDESAACEKNENCIVVYGRLHEESQIEIPVAETVFSSEQIDNTGIERVKDFIQLTPNLSIVQSQSIGTSFMSIRGMTQVRNGEMPVAVVVDDVLQINPRQFTQDMLDTQYIEVLKGPQGALYGRNATGGAIVIQTKPPTLDTTGKIRIGAGNGGRQYVQAGVSSSFNENLSYRISALDNQFDGLIKNIYLNKEVDYMDETAFRGVLFYTPSDTTEMTLTGKHSSVEGGSMNYVYQPALLASDGVTLAPGPFPFDFSNVDANDASRDISANNLGYNERDIDELSFKLRLFTGQLEWLSITSYTGVEEYSAGDQFPYTAATTRNTLLGDVDGTQTQYVDVDSWSQEFRLLSKMDSMNWMVGVYYLKTERFISTTTGDDRGQGVTRIEQTPNYTSPTNPTSTFLGDDNDNNAWAIYGNISYDVTEELELSAALRYDRDNRKQRVSVYNTSGTPGAVNTATFDQWQPKLSARYMLQKDMSIFASWGKGFRSGQFNQNGVAATAAQAGINGVNDIADKEVSESYELGYKGFFERLGLTLTANAFRTNVRGQQYFIFIAPVGAQVITNIDEVLLYGGELGMHLSIDDAWAITLDYGYTQSKIEKYKLDSSLEGNMAPYVPRSSFNVGIEYQSSLTQNFDLLLRTDYEKKGLQYWSPENITPRHSVELVNFRAGLSTKDKSWSLIASVKNALDKRFNSEYVSGGFAHRAPPRQWTLDLSYQF